MKKIAEKKCTPKVSVLVPICNVETYLEECLKSLRAQTLKDMQFICINDGSTDTSLDILERFAESDSRFVIIDKPNTGYGHSMNTGLKAASGKYIGIVESDDYILPNMFEDLFYEAEKNNAQIAKSNYYEKNRKLCPDKIYREVLADCEYGKVLCPQQQNQIFSHPLCIWSAIYEKKFLFDNKIWFNETPGASYQDISFNFKTLFLAKRVVLLKNAYYIYRRDNETSSVNNHTKVFAVRDEYQTIEEFMEGKDCNKQMHEIKAALKINSYIWNYYNLASAYQYAFLLEMNEAFRKERIAGYLHVDMWEEHIWNDINEIIDDREAYFHRTSKYYVNYRLNNMSSDQNYEIYLSGVKYKLENASEIWLHLDGKIEDKLSTLEEKNIEVRMVLVSDKMKYPDILEGVPIVESKTIQALKRDVLVLVRTSEEDSYQIKDSLHEQGFESVIVWDDTFNKCLVEKW